MVNGSGLTLETLVDGAEKCLANAEQLNSNALMLADENSFGVAAFLHQTSLEECAKIDLIGEQATLLLQGGVIDAVELQKALNSHKSKKRCERL
jgi:AbiV family abortive infection protein